MMSFDPSLPRQQQKQLEVVCCPTQDFVSGKKSFEKSDTATSTTTKKKKPLQQHNENRKINAKLNGCSLVGNLGRQQQSAAARMLLQQQLENNGGGLGQKNKQQRKRILEQKHEARKCVSYRWKIRIEAIMLLCILGIPGEFIDTYILEDWKNRKNPSKKPEHYWKGLKQSLLFYF